MCCLPVYVLTLSYCHFLCWNVLNKELRTLILLHWKKYKQRFAYILHLHVINLCFKDEVRRSIFTTSTTEEENSDIGRSYSDITLTKEK